MQWWPPVGFGELPPVGEELTYKIMLQNTNLEVTFTLVHSVWYTLR